MADPIRITFRENPDHFIEAQGQLPPAEPLIPERKMNLFLGILVVGTFLFALNQQYQQGASLKVLFAGAVFVVAVMAFWFWLFKKIGLHKTKPPSEYRWTEGDRARLKKTYLRKIGCEERNVACEFTELGFSLQPENDKPCNYDWVAVRKVVERPKGVLVFIRKSAYFWFPRRMFATPELYREFLELAEKWAPGFQRLKLAVVALGSNLGDSTKTLRDAMARLQHFSDERVLESSLWQTAPVDCPLGSPKFLNAVAGLIPRREETPESLLEKLRALETEFGRVPKQLLNEPRPLDLDLIAFGNETRHTPHLTLPHPRAHLRRFVLAPLNQIAPDLVLPGQAKSISELLAMLPDADEARRMD